MEETDLLKERLQAITYKRRVQENIIVKRRQIEEEKLKLQYIKKRALREQWLMDGLSQQSQEEQEAMRLQAQDEQQQSDQLQSNIYRMEKEIEDLETQEMNISANEEIILKRLKEVERTAEDIIKKATAVAKEMDGKELEDVCSRTENHHFFTMDTTEQSESAMDCEVEATVTDLQEKEIEQEMDLDADVEQVSLETDSSAFLGLKAMPKTVFIDLTSNTDELDKPDCSDTSLCIELPSPDQKEALLIESGHKELNVNESITPSVSDMMSSSDSVIENEAQHKRQDTQEQVLEPEPVTGDNETNPEDDGYQNLPIETEVDPVVPKIPFDLSFTEESMLEQCIKGEAMSDVSNESCHDLDPGEMEECLRFEIVSASSGSDTDEKWRTIFSSSINKEDDDSYLDSLQLSAQELFIQRDEVRDIEQKGNTFEEVQLEFPQEEVLEQPDEIVSFTTPPQLVAYNPLSRQGLSNISEDENENWQNANHNHSNHHQHLNSDPRKKLPKDFCVIQETKSENVSTEHVDFQMARKQWLEMEERTKKQIVSPTTKQPSFHGSHSLIYRPVCNTERPRKTGHKLENLNLVGEDPHPQFSPCSEDSGLDDSSYRSTYDDPETSNEKEICIAMERDENFRRERGKSTHYAPSQSILRSTSTPLIITPSLSKGPLRHEVSANNVIILEPGNDFPSSPKHGKDTLAAQSGEWHTDDGSANLIILETSNLIIHSASEFCLSKVCEQDQEKMFLSNPFFKLRSRSTTSLVDEEIKMAKLREEELRQVRVSLYGKDSLPNPMDSLAFDNSVKCKSSPSSPMKTAYRMDHSALACDHMRSTPEKDRRVPWLCTGRRGIYQKMTEK